jgi:hypothetical protein
MPPRSRVGEVLRHPLFLTALAGLLVIVLVSVLRSGDDGPAPVSGTPKEAVEVVEAFQIGRAHV